MIMYLKKTLAIKQMLLLLLLVQYPHHKINRATKLKQLIAKKLMLLRLLFKQKLKMKVILLKIMEIDQEHIEEVEAVRTEVLIMIPEEDIEEATEAIRRTIIEKIMEVTSKATKEKELQSKAKKEATEKETKEVDTTKIMIIEVVIRNLELAIKVKTVKEEKEEVKVEETTVADREVDIEVETTKVVPKVVVKATTKSTPKLAQGQHSVNKERTQLEANNIQIWLQMDLKWFNLGLKSREILLPLAILSLEDPLQDKAPFT